MRSEVRLSRPASRRDCSASALCSARAASPTCLRSADASSSRSCAEAAEAPPPNLPLSREPRNLAAIRRSLAVCSRARAAMSRARASATLASARSMRAFSAGDRLRKSRMAVAAPPESAMTSTGICMDTARTTAARELGPPCTTIITAGTPFICEMAVTTSRLKVISRPQAKRPCAPVAGRMKWVWLGSRAAPDAELFASL
mmetsp:Transcript_22592/g.66613  ORF Transcript_22592/g.66613 Transcript_22592/m.66613 type:complete len:201 (-) Transcript_22592:544-1146(-)